VAIVPLFDVNHYWVYVAVTQQRRAGRQFDEGRVAGRAAVVVGAQQPGEGDIAQGKNGRSSLVSPLDWARLGALSARPSMQMVQPKDQAPLGAPGIIQEAA
jgi:hypothetical protein